MIHSALAPITSPSHLYPVTFKRIRSHESKSEAALCVHNLPLAIVVRGVWFSLDQIVGQQQPHVLSPERDLDFSRGRDFIWEPGTLNFLPSVPPG